MAEYKNLNQAESFIKLKKYKQSLSLKELIHKDRIESFQTQAGAGILYNYASKYIDNEIIAILQELADEMGLIEKYKLLLNGDLMNPGEGRKVLHHLTRGQQAGDVLFEGENLGDFYKEQQQRIFEFAGHVHSGEIKGSTGKVFDTVVQIGIGGSDLGPKAMYLALKQYASVKNMEKMKAYFISNVDPDDSFSVMNSINPETTLFIVVSKSGTTQETLTNKNLALHHLQKSEIPGINPSKHIIAVTSKQSPMASSPDFRESFYIDDFIGGRYSSTSAVGTTVLSLAFGKSIVTEFLTGAAEADHNALEKNIHKNAALLDALIGVYERNVLKYPVTAILPYSQALNRFPAHLQQLDMESNGKSVNRSGEKVSYKTGPVIFGEPGTNGQHSFYQLLHQGTDIIPLQFIGFKHSQVNEDPVFNNYTSQQKLNANLCAQIAAFASGKTDENPNKNFEGLRPSSLLFADQLTPAVLGALLAHFENKVMFQGFTWNINSFDQEGVQLGKKLTNLLLEKTVSNAALETYASFFGL